MTLAREAALSLVKLVIRYASPNSKVWAQAMLGELSSIENDWRAFRWALGSMQLLFRHSEGNITTLAEVPAAAETLAGQMTQRTWAGGAVVIAMALFFASLAPRAPDAFQREGCALLAVAMLYMLFQLLSARPHKGTGTDLLSKTTHYSAELSREVSFHRGFTFWSRLCVLIPGFTLLAIGRMIASQGAVTTDAVELTLFLFFAALAIPRNQRFARRYATQLQCVRQLQDEQRLEA